MNEFFSARMAGAKDWVSKTRLVSVAIIGLGWVVLIGWRPLVLGFYGDDWASTALPLDKAGSPLGYLFSDPSRILYVLIVYGLRVALGTSAPAWQLTIALFSLLGSLGAAFAASAISTRVIGVSERAATLSSTLAGLLWLAFPWSLGYSAWPVMSAPLLSTALALFGVGLFVQRGAGKVLTSLLLITGGWLVYEATWFVWIPAAFLSAAGRLRGREPLGAVVLQIVVAGSAQAIAIGLNRLLSAGTPGGKSVSSAVWSTLQADQNLVQQQLWPLLGDLRGLVLVTALLIVVIGVMAAVASRRVLSTVAVLTACAVGITVSVLTYAIAGYGIQWTGLFSRVTMLTSVWLAIGGGTLLSVALDGRSTILKLWATIVAGFLVGGTSASLISQTMAWKASWGEQQEIIAAVPQGVLDLIRANSIVLFEVPNGTPPVYTFSNFWDISGAIQPRTDFVRFAREWHDGPLATVLRPKEFRTTWDGSILSQAWCTSADSVLWKFHEQRVYIWHYPDKSAVPVDAPYDSGC